MSLDKAIKIIKIFGEEDIEKLSKKSFELAISKVKFTVNNNSLQKLTAKSDQMIKWISDEITLAKANDIYERLTEEEMDEVLVCITKPSMVKLIGVMLKPSDAVFLRVGALDVGLVTKFIEVIKEDDESLANELEESLKAVISRETTSKHVLN